MATRSNTYDAIVIGGGPGGSSAVSVLSSRSCEYVDRPMPAKAFEHRCNHRID